jgi:hypothetical protein
VTDAADARRQGSPPRGGDLLALLAADLPGCELTRVDDRLAVATVDGQPRFLVEQRVEKRKLITLRTTVCHVLAQPAAVEGRVELRHTGQVRRTGLDATRRAGDELAMRALADHLLADGELEAASLELDFTRFVVEVVDGRWRASLELMGGSHVRTTLPPSSRYVKLPADQVRPLVRTIAVLRRRLPADDAALVALLPPGSVAPADAASVADPDHLPRSDT